jgi:hypothetical protein
MTVDISTGSLLFDAWLVIWCIVGIVWLVRGFR